MYCASNQAGSFVRSLLGGDDSDPAVDRSTGPGFNSDSSLSSSTRHRGQDDAAASRNEPSPAAGGDVLFSASSASSANSWGLSRLGRRSAAGERGPRAPSSRPGLWLGLGWG